MPPFTTARQQRIVSPCKKAQTVGENFRLKPPVKIVFEKLGNSEPGQKRRKITRDETISSTKPTLVLQEDNIINNINLTPHLQENNNNNFSPKKSSCIKYDNCVFHGNITNNFYYCNDFEK